MSNWKNAILTGLCAVAVVCGLNTSANAETIKLATLIPTGSSWYGPLRDMADAWQTASNGRLRITVYPGGVAGDDPEVVRKLRVGQLQAATITTQGLGKIVPDIIALHLPMLVHSNAELDYIRTRMQPEIQARIKRRGFTVLNWADAGWIRFFCRKPVVHPDDLKPLKIFVWSGNTAVVKAWRDAGYRPVPLAATDILGGLQSGMIDCVPTVPIAALSYQWFGLARHMTDLKWAPFTGATVIATRAWDKLPNDLRQRMRTIAEKTGNRLKERTRALDRQSIEAMQRYGLKVHKVPPEAMREWEQRAQAAYPAIKGTVVSPKFLRRVEKLKTQFRNRPARGQSGNPKSADPETHVDLDFQLHVKG